MTLAHKFSVSAQIPFYSSYDPEFPDQPYVNAYLAAYGGYSGWRSPYRLADQLDADELVVGNAPTDPSDENDIVSVFSELTSRSCFAVHLAARNVRPDLQYLVVFGFRRRTSGPTAAQFFVGTRWVQTEQINDETEAVALLLDSPSSILLDAPSQWLVTLWVRLASQVPGAKLGLTGVDGYLL